MHGLGPRPLGELFVELARKLKAGDCGVNTLTTLLEGYAAIDPELLTMLGGRYWPIGPQKVVLPIPLSTS